MPVVILPGEGPVGDGTVELVKVGVFLEFVTGASVSELAQAVGAETPPLELEIRRVRRRPSLLRWPHRSQR